MSENGNVVVTHGAARSMLFRRIRRILGILVLGATCYLVVWTLLDNWGEVASLEQSFDRTWLSVHFACVLGYFALQPVVWYAVVRSCGERPTGSGIVISAYLPCLGKYIPGKVWAVLSRAYFLVHYGGASRRGAATATAMQYVMEVLGALPYLFILAWLAPIPEMHYSKMAIVAAPLVLLVFFPRVTQAILGNVSSLLGMKSRDMPAFRVSPALFLGFTGHWLLYAASGVALCMSIGVLDRTNLAAIACGFVASWLLGFVSLLTPGGIGVRESVMIVILTPIVGKAPAVLVPVIARISWTAAEAAAVAVALAVIWFRTHSLRILGASEGELQQ